MTILISMESQGDHNHLSMFLSEKFSKSIHILKNEILNKKINSFFLDLFLLMESSTARLYYPTWDILYIILRKI